MRLKSNDLLCTNSRLLISSVIRYLHLNKSLTCASHKRKERQQPLRNAKFKN